MNDTRRDQLIKFVEREFIGPDPIDWPGLVQENGEEVLVSDPPRVRYIAGILFPKESLDEDAEPDEEELNADLELDDHDEQDDETGDAISSGDAVEYLEEAEELINRSNAYRQSAISLTVAIHDGDTIYVEVEAGIYIEHKSVDPDSGTTVSRYRRKPIRWKNDERPLNLSSREEGIQKIPVDDTGLQFDITYRYSKDNSRIYTFTLENTNDKHSSVIHDEDCFFQVRFKLRSESGFCPLPDNQRINTDDEDYWSNQMLYRNVRNYAIGHGCAADWEEKDGEVSWISTAIFPSYEIKPIVPSVIPGVTLEMFKMSDYGDISSAIEELRLMCEKYQDWINSLKEKALSIEPQYRKTAQRHIANCEKCLERMNDGIDLLEQNSLVREAFQLMNRAMLLQQLHYNLPLQKWTVDSNGELKLENPIERLPEVDDPSSWYDKENRVYGRWRPFQLAFILINLRSMYDRNSNERRIVDLIWFPTGGGKTEAYLGLSAYTIFIRRLKNKDDAGTTILMRYTLRLLTAQQYERAASMICACEMIRRESPERLGDSRISIGLWVGGTTTPNKMKEAVRAYDDLYNGKSNLNPFVILKCPWCGAQMGPVEESGSNNRYLPGYKKDVGPRGRKKIVFQCRNTDYNCAFSLYGNELPLYVVDEVIYENHPTLLLGTVDKFAMLPFRPQAQGLFGYKNGEKVSSPDLIIQDELHLISGPLGSMVGHYETLIHELCTYRKGFDVVFPKIIASTATISRAKEQCHALYGCGKENVFQFPPSGLDAGDSFFAIEDKKRKGRKYVGILASGSSSDATTAIRLYSSLLYGAKAMIVDSEEMRDPYWTNIGYFNSLRELGQAATWIKADIDQHLDVMYKRRFDHKRYSKEEYRQTRRYIWRHEELTSRIRSDKVTASLANLNVRYPPETDLDGKVKEHPIDICLATNMISVGLDVPRLGLMTVAGQPKTTSEYIQATSRVGRDAEKAPGIVFILYRPGKPRDKSHYEHFRSYHSRIYCHVEPTSVTPFSAPVRERALHAIMIGIMRLQGDEQFNSDPPRLPDYEIYKRVKAVIESRVEAIDSDELNATLDHMEYIIQYWEDWNPEKWVPQINRDLSYGDALPLMFPSGSQRNEAWGKRGLPTPTSMRNVDAACEVRVLETRYKALED